MDHFKREKKKETIFDRLTITEAVVVVVILINSTVVGLFVMYYLPVSGLDLIGFEPYRQAHESHSVSKTDSDMINISGTMIKWPDKLSDMEEEYVYGTDWRDPDTDKDGMEDGWEVHYSTRREWIYSMQYPDPLIADPFDNYDGDGFDADRNGLIEDDEALFNLREYCGGALYDMEEGAFVSTEPIFGGLDPAEDWREIGMKGGYHLFDAPWDGIVGDPDDPDDENYDDYFWYDPENERFPPPTTDPSTPDTDGDGMPDGWELHYARMLKEMGDIYPGNILTIAGDIDPIDKQIIDPLSSGDAGLDMDARRTTSITGGIKEQIYIYSKDGLTNLEEFEVGTNPLLWDSDEDSFFDIYKGELFELDDRTEVRMEYLNSSLWNWNWDCPYPFENYRLDPMDPDTDGDGMPDGWELTMGLNPLNGTDYFKDLDGDGLPNYMEYAFPNMDNVWFRTDPRNPDTDADGMPDGWEAYNSKIISQIPATSTRDDLEDKIPDGKRTVFTVSPMIPDAEEDNDGYWETDEWGVEIYCRRDDGVTNYEEFMGSKYYPRSSDPSDADSDDDGLYDGEEMKYGFPGELIGGRFVTNPDIAARYHTNHNAPDTDMDRWGLSYDGPRILTDWEEVHGRTRDVQPRNGFDDDGDGEVDEYEGEYLFFSPTNASNPDSDLDGLMDVDEVFGIDTRYFWQWSELGVIRTDPTMTDSDGDGLSDLAETNTGVYNGPSDTGTDPANPDTDGDGLLDGQEDQNRNGRLDEGETDPNDWDTDDGGVDDGTEVLVDLTDPLEGSDDIPPDRDGDGLTDDEEQALDLPRDEFDLPVVIQDRIFDDENGLVYMGHPMERMTGFLGNRILVNGRPRFTQAVASRPYRL
ncbi:MAG: hypothetical protein ACMUHU_07060, partial [Thermoplasmatota archaeon]